MSDTTPLHYLDYAATTPADPRVIEAMTACLGFDGIFGNPASSRMPPAGSRKTRSSRPARKSPR